MNTRALAALLKDQEAIFTVGSTSTVLPETASLVVHNPETNESRRIEFSKYRDMPCDTVLEDPGMQHLVQLAKQAPFGRGYETIVDEQVRKALVVTPDKLSFSPEFFSLLDDILPTISDFFSSPAHHPDHRVRAEFYRLNMYRPGDFFVSHIDTPRNTTTHFGTLVVCLPVPHQGGELVVENADRSSKFVHDQWGQASSKGLVSWGAHYCDLKHQVLPVLAGMRVTLTWNLYYTPHSILFSKQQLRHPVCSALEACCKHLKDENDKSLAWVCLHKYFIHKDRPTQIDTMLRGCDAILYTAAVSLGLEVKLVASNVWRQWRLHDFFCGEEKKERDAVKAIKSQYGVSCSTQNNSTDKKDKDEESEMDEDEDEEESKDEDEDEDEDEIEDEEESETEDEEAGLPIECRQAIRRVCKFSAEADKTPTWLMVCGNFIMKKLSSTFDPARHSFMKKLGLEWEYVDLINTKDVSQAPCYETCEWDTGDDEYTGNEEIPTVEIGSSKLVMMIRPKGEGKK